MRERRFLVDELSGPSVELTGADRHHAVDVLRLGVGDRVVLFDGKGREATARIEAVTADRVELRLLEAARDVRRGTVSLTLAVAPPKGARADWLVEKCAEFGVHQLVFIRTARGVVEPGPGKAERWRRKAVEAAKQSGAACVMSIEAGLAIADLLSARERGEQLYYGAVGAGAPRLTEKLAELRAGRDQGVGVTCLIGPEGGFTEEELTELSVCGVEPVSLGDTVLRVETAAVAVAAIWSGEC